jgi:uncharacterized membrane protein
VNLAHDEASKGQIQQQASQTISGVQYTYSGPLPHPEILERYERIVPGSAERIFAQFELQSAHRHKIESQVISSNTFCQKLGTVSALLICLLTIGGGLFLVHEGQSVAGITALLGTLGSFVGVFIFGRQGQATERKSKS